MSTPNNPVQPQTKKDEAEVLASFQLAHDHHHVGDTNASDARAQKMQNVSVVMEDTRKMLERSGFVSVLVTPRLLTMSRFLTHNGSITRPLR